jgi:hypothetical protein
LLAASNVFHDFRYIAPEELGDYLAAASALVAPYQEKSALNSGTLWTALSYGKPFVCPEIACVQGRPDIADCCYIYENGALQSALERFERDCGTPGELERKGQAALAVMEGQAWAAHKKEWCGLFSS